MLKFKIEQIAIAPPDPIKAELLLREMGAVEWVRDHVTAEGKVFDEPEQNEADLAFNYDMFNPSKTGEFEILNYTIGNNWLKQSARESCVSHLGMHCTAEELSLWREFFKQRKIGVAQEVFTSNHTNTFIKDKRWYNYVIFNTRPILGVDLKFIVRLEAPGKI